MNDLISRAAAIHIAERYGCNNGSSLGRHSGVADCIASEIAALQTVDAAPVRHGRWAYFNCVGNGRYQCSECLHWIDAGLDKNYCPNCGAKMDVNEGD